MKKLMAIFALLLASTFFFTGCVGASITYDGEYWNKNSSAFTAIEETIVYDVTTTYLTPSYESEVKNDFIKLEIEEGTYTVKLTGVLAKVNYYVLETELKIKGQYVLGFNTLETPQTIPVDDYLKTYTKFESIENAFKPIYSMRTTYNEATQTKHYNTSVYSYMDGYVESHLAYEYSIEYGGKNAKSNLVYSVPVRDETTNEIIDEQTIEEAFTYNSYDSGAFIDNNLLTFLPRAFNLKDSFYQEFTTIDVPTHDVKKMLYTISQSSSAVSVQVFENLTYNYVLNGEQKTIESGFNTHRLYSAINDTFSGAPIELYYAVDTATHRHRLIKSYTALNDNMGFIEYTIKSVNVTEGV